MIGASQGSGEVGPFSGYEGTRLVRQNQQKMKSPVSTTSAKNSQALADKHVPFANYGDGLRKAFEMGSLWWFPSAAFHTQN